MIHSKYMDLKGTFLYIIENGKEWYSESFNSATGLTNILSKTQFIFLLCLYNEIFVYIDHLFAVLQHKVASDINMCNNEIENTMEKLRNMRKEEMVNTCIENCRKIYNDVRLTESDIQCCKTLTYEILDTLIVQMETRFCDLKHIEFIELVNEKNFGAYNLKFPEKMLKSLASTYSFFNQD